jgi:hemerythrin-like domain-containing protein
MIREMLGIAEGILQDLHNDHTEVAALLERISNSENAANRGALFKEMSTKLLAHAKAEQEVLYSRMKNSPNEESRQFALEGTSEHGLIEQQVQKLSGMDDSMSDAWAAELKVLEDLIDHHVEEEEDTGFGCARDDFETDELEAMRDEFQRRKQEQMLSARN